jgi:hypothetical protein
MSSFEIYQNIQIQQKLNKALQTQERDKLAGLLNSNNHTLIALMPNEYLNLIASIKKSKGYTHQQTLDWIDNIVTSTAGVSATTKSVWSAFKATWSEHSNTGKTLASYWPVLTDTKVLGVLALEMKRGGDILSKYKVVSYPNKTFIALYSEPALRKHLTRNVFIASSPQVVNLGIGKLGALNAIKTGAKFTVYFSIGFHAIDQLMNDELTWHHFVGGVAIDIVLAAAASGIVWGIVAFTIGTAAMLTIGPMLIVVGGGIGLTMFFNSIATEYKLVQKMVDLLLEAERRNKKNIATIQRQVTRSLTYAKEDPVGFMHTFSGIPYFNQDKSSHVSAARGR